jgi:hypothetical protein
MSFVAIWLERFELLSHEFSTEFENQRVKLSQVDKMLQSVLHELEKADLETIGGYGFAKRIQELRLERRNIKNEYILSQIVNSLLHEDIHTKLIRIKKSIEDREQLDD